MAERMDTVSRVGPLHFTGAAADRVATVREDNDYEAVDVKKWRANIDKQHDAMSNGDVEFFATLRNRMG